jgi:hypothetical protein
MRLYRLKTEEPILDRLVATGLLIFLAASCSSANESDPTTATTSSAPVTKATKQPGPELERIIKEVRPFR